MNLKLLRLERGFSVPALVKLSGVPRRTIQEIEKRDACTVENAIKLADALGVTLDEFCRTAPPKGPAE
jgi:predicted transcriptional regulator